MKTGRQTSESSDLSTATSKWLAQDRELGREGEDAQIASGLKTDRSPFKNRGARPKQSEIDLSHWNRKRKVSEGDGATSRTGEGGVRTYDIATPEKTPPRLRFHRINVPSSELRSVDVHSEVDRHREPHGGICDGSEGQQWAICGGRRGRTEGRKAQRRTQKPLRVVAASALPSAENE